MPETKNEAFDYLRVIWKRKWLIIIPTFLCTAAVGALSFFLPMKWEIDCIAKPGHIAIQTGNNLGKDFNLTDPEQLTEVINQGIYNRAIAETNQIELSNFPKITAVNPEKTSLIKISLRDTDPERGKSILLHLVRYLRNDFDQSVYAEKRKLEIEASNKEILIKDYELDIQEKEYDIAEVKNEIKKKKIEIKANESQKIRKEQEIQSYAKAVKISGERTENIRSEMKAVKQRAEELRAQHRDAEADEKNALILLLDSNRIQEDLRFYNELGRELSEEKVQQEQWKMLIHQKQEEIRSLDMDTEKIQVQIADLKIKINYSENEIGKIKNNIQEVQNTISLMNERKDMQIQPTTLVKQPTASFSPVSPNKTLKVLAAAILSLVLFTMVAFFVEYYFRAPSSRRNSE